MAVAARRVGAEALEAFAAALFAKAGTSAADARAIAEVLVWANLRGVDTHGVLRAPGYLARISGGEANPRPDMRAVVDLPAAQVLDADRAFGPVAMVRAADMAIARARRAGIAAVFVRRTTHIAAVGFYALRAAAADMLGLVVGTSRPNMAWHGARSAGVATAPIAIAAPGLDRAPLMLDMATSVASMGRIMLARDSGEALAPGQALDRGGAPTEDPFRAALPLPLGGPKGAGLALMFECLTGLLAASPLLAPALGPERRTAHSQNAMVLAVDVAAFTDPAGYKAEVDRLAAALKALPRAEGHDEILVPGERGDRVREERRRAGIPIPDGTWRRLEREASRLGLAMPETLRSDS